MTSWPTAPLIRIIRGTEYEEPIDGSLAVREDPEGEYRLVSGPRAKNTVNPACTRTDSIDEWEEVTAVPTAALAEFKAAWKGFGAYDADGSQRVTVAVAAILACLPVDKPSALDRAVIEVKGVKGAVLHLSDFDPEGRLALLLGCLATLQAADHKTPALAMVARICVEWVNLLNPGGDALSEVKACVESDPDWGGFIVMSSLAGDAAAALGDSMNNSLKKCLLTIAHHALVWMTGLIEEGER